MSFTHDETRRLIIRMGNLRRQVSSQECNDFFQVWDIQGLTPTSIANVVEEVIVVLSFIYSVSICIACVIAFLVLVKSIILFNLPHYWRNDFN